MKPLIRLFIFGSAILLLSNRAFSDGICDDSLQITPNTVCTCPPCPNWPNAICCGYDFTITNNAPSPDRDCYVDSVEIEFVLCQVYFCSPCNIPARWNQYRGLNDCFTCDTLSATNPGASKVGFAVSACGYGIAPGGSATFSLCITNIAGYANLPMRWRVHCCGSACNQWSQWVPATPSKNC